MSQERRIVLEDVSKFYGEVLGINRVSLNLEPGITSLVGPNGSGKTTLMNLLTGLIKPTRGRLRLLGIDPANADLLCGRIGYCTQFDAFPRSLTGFQFIYSFLRIHGYGAAPGEEMAWNAIERVNLMDAAHRKVAAYSKGMRQRIKLAQAIAHDPDVLILDEPLNGLDPMARAEIIALFQKLAAEDRHILISSHILHEVDVISDSVVMINGGYVVAEGDIQSVRGDMPEHPIQVLIRCNLPGVLASRLFEMNHVVEARVQADGRGLLIRTRDAEAFYLNLNRAILDSKLEIETVAPADEDVGSVYEYLIGQNGDGA